MSTYPNMNNEPELLKIKTRNDDIKNTKFVQENMIMKIYQNLLK